MTPAADERGSDLRQRFIAHYRGPHEPQDAWWWLQHPELTGPSGAPSPLQKMLVARKLLYRRQVDPDSRVQYDHLAAAALTEHAIAAAAFEAALRDQPASVPEASTPSVSTVPVFAPSPPGAPARRPRATILITAVLALLLGLVTGWVIPYGESTVTPTTPSGVVSQRDIALLRTAIEHGDGTLAPDDYYSRVATALPDGWQDASSAESFRTLDGTTAVTIPTSRVTQTLLVGVACSPAAGTWTVQVLGGTAARTSGTCGRLQLQPLAVVRGFDRLRLLASASGPGGLALSVYQH